jgi:hypothetical protein
VDLQGDLDVLAGAGWRRLVAGVEGAVGGAHVACWTSSTSS